MTLSLRGLDGGDCLTGADDPCPIAGWVPICPGTSCPDNSPEDECQGSCYKVPDHGTSWADFAINAQSRLGDGESIWQCRVYEKAPLIFTLRCHRYMRHVPQLRGA